jgi:hypothetical protein
MEPSLINPIFIDWPIEILGVFPSRAVWEEVLKTNALFCVIPPDSHQQVQLDLTSSMSSCFHEASPELPGSDGACSS